MEDKNFEEKVFHDTKLLLEHYRNVVWSLEVEAFQTSMNFQKEYGTTLEEFLDLTYKAGMDISKSDVASRIESMNKSRNMLRIIDTAVEFLRNKHHNGEVYYIILYHAYLSPRKVSNMEMIIKQLEKYVLDISSRTYYRLKKKAIMELGWLLWGYTTRETEPIIDRLLEKTPLQTEDCEEEYMK